MLIVLLASTAGFCPVIAAQQSLSIEGPAQQAEPSAGENAGVRSAKPVGDVPSPAPTVTIGPGDLIELVVFDTPELSQKLRVDSSGAVTLPVGGRVQIAGFSAEEAKRTIEAALLDRDILREPHVSVLVAEYATQGISVLGEVKNPGVYPVLGRRTLLDVVSAAGGFTATASRTVTISHADGSEQAVQVRLQEQNAFRTGNNPVLYPGDRVLVRRAALVYVLGDVGKPGGYVSDQGNSITVLRALALAQGMNKTAQMSGTLIDVRAGAKSQTRIDLRRILRGEDPDPSMQDGDILFVPVSGSKEWSSKGVTSILQMAVGVVVYGVF